MCVVLGEDVRSNALLEFLELEEMQHNIYYGEFKTENWKTFHPRYLMSESDIRQKV